MKEFLNFLISKEFLKQVLYIFIFLAVVLFLTLMWLNIYTNHGQKIEMGDYVNQSLEKAREAAKASTFEVIVTDSTHIVGKPGGLIISQNPKAGSFVKENRKVYVRTTKYNADQILVEDLPLLYGTNYKQATIDLKSRSIFADIKSRRRDPGQPDHILEVWYEGNLIINKNVIKKDTKIEKGGKLQFVISESTGGSFIIPELTCKNLTDAKSYMLYSELKLGNIIDLTEDVSESELWIVSQFPKADGSRKLGAGMSIDVKVSKNKPDNCK